MQRSPLSSLHLHWQWGCWVSRSRSGGKTAPLQSLPTHTHPAETPPRPRCSPCSEFQLCRSPPRDSQLLDMLDTQPSRGLEGSGGEGAGRWTPARLSRPLLAAACSRPPSGLGGSFPRGYGPPVPVPRACPSCTPRTRQVPHSTAARGGPPWRAGPELGATQLWATLPAITPKPAAVTAPQSLGLVGRGSP